MQPLKTSWLQKKLITFAGRFCNRHLDERADGLALSLADVSAVIKKKKKKIEKKREEKNHYKAFYIRRLSRIMVAANTGLHTNLNISSRGKRCPDMEFGSVDGGWMFSR